MSNHAHRGPVGQTSSRVSPPLGQDPLKPPVTPPSPPEGPGVQLPPPEFPTQQTPPPGPVPITDGTPAGCYQKNAADFLRGDVSTSVMAYYGQQLFGTEQHTRSAHPAPEEDESGVDALTRWREDAPYG